MTGRPHPQEKLPLPFPKGLEYLWRWFCELEGSRPFADGAMLPIPASEILAWATLARVRPRPWELSILRALDATALKVAMEKDT